MIKKRIIFILFFFISLTILKGQAITSVTVLNGSFITTVDTVFLRVTGGFSNLGGVTSKSVSILDTIVTATIKGCTTGLSTITFIDEIVKISPLPQGKYKVKVKLIEYDNFVFPGCNVQKSYNSDSLNITVVTYTSIDEVKQILENVSFYPNPANNKITIANNVKQPFDKICICNSLGQNIFLLNNPLPNQDIDLNHLESGLYYLSIHRGSYQRTYKILKQ
ncbi:MAG: T9SS type A sorting domain-containing protein [Bacteroidetes bacterium]|nr:T9SS type A sorting domain-containing protein [Bacteroidota bacterium]